MHRLSRMFLMLLLILLLVTGCSNSGNSSDSSAPELITPPQEELITETVEKGTINKVSRINGSVVPVSVVDACFKFRSGYLKSINVKPGDTVKKGDVLATLDASDINYSIQQQEIKVKLAQLNFDQAAANKASDFDIQKASLMLDGEKLQMEQLNYNLQNCTLTASISGKVIKVANIKPSQYITGDLALVTIADPDDYMVQCDSSDTSFKIGSKVTMQTKSAGTIGGEVVENTALGKSSPGNQNTIMAKFYKEPSNIQLGETVSLVYTLPAKDNVIVIPPKAVRYDEGDRPFVRLQQPNGEITERYISTGEYNNGLIEIKNGLSVGEVVILN